MNERAKYPEIILVGVVHGDPEGYNKLKRLLRRARPLLVSVEISEYSWRYRCRWQARWQRQFQLASQALPPELRRHLALQRVAAQISHPFEVKAAEDYAQERGAPWRAIDLNTVAREHLPLYEGELLSVENLRHLILTPDADWQEHIKQEYQRARRALQAGGNQKLMVTAKSSALYSPPSPSGERVKAELSPQTTLREKVLARRVARLAKEWSRIVHVGGWEHLVRSSVKTLPDFLVALRPKIILLDESSSEF